MSVAHPGALKEMMRTVANKQENTGYEIRTTTGIATTGNMVMAAHQKINVKKLATGVARPGATPYQTRIVVHKRENTGCKLQKESGAMTSHLALAALHKANVKKMGTVAAQTGAIHHRM